MTEAYIPYGAYWSTPFARWQGTFSHLHSLKFAAHVAKAELAARDIAPERFDSACSAPPSRRSTASTACRG